ISLESRGISSIVDAGIRSAAAAVARRVAVGGRRAAERTINGRSAMSPNRIRRWISRAAVALACLSILNAPPALAQCEHPFFETPDVYVPGYGRCYVTLGDVNNDGWVDMAVANRGLYGIVYDVVVLLNNGDGSFQSPARYDAGEGPHDLALGDLNGDSWPDMAVANSHSDDISILFNLGNGTFGETDNYSFGSDPIAIATGDVDGDDWLDVAVGNDSNDTVSILINNGDGTFAQPAHYSAGDAPHSVVFGDLNSDSWPDVVVGRFSGAISVLLNNGDGTFADYVQYSAGQYAIDADLGDLNGDESIDIAVAAWGASKVSILLNNGDGTFADPVSYPAGPYPASIVVSDMDGDDWLDVAVANEYSASFYATVLLNNGDGTFGNSYSYDTGNWNHSIDAADLDNDGWCDMAVASYHDDDDTNTVAVFLNLCPNSCPADFDEDGDVDTEDLLYLLATWGTPDGDVDGDGDTDTADLLALLAAWGECYE
ncbi:MAG: VCBS repeat-containing protein, partial [Planctomycetota bacterium]|nr:VCBS repeat-containing protein [Planctomycetota bacterium]